MLAASFWSLLEPAIELAAKSGTYGPKGELAFVPVAVGFVVGVVFVYGSDLYLQDAVNFYVNCVSAI
jgi:zinc transporter 11